MDIHSFKQYLEIAKELNISKFRIEDNKLYAEFRSHEELVSKPINLADVLGDMPSDRALLNLQEIETPKES